MARKKPAAIEALERATAPQTHCHACKEDARVRLPNGEPSCMTHYTAYFTEQAQQNIKDHSLARKPKESISDWRARMKKWLNDNARIKRMERA